MCRILNIYQYFMETNYETLLHYKTHIKFIIWKICTSVTFHLFTSWQNVWAGMPPGPLVHIVSFEDDGTGGARVSLKVRADSAADCARLLKRGMCEGIGQGLDRLERLLRELRGSGT